MLFIKKELSMIFILLQNFHFAFLKGALSFALFS